MKNIRTHLLPLLLAVTLLGTAGCSTNHLLSHVKHTHGSWLRHTIQPGLTLYTYSGTYPAGADKQYVSILQVSKKYFNFQAVQALPYDSLSSVVSHYPQAVAGINGTYFQVLKKGEAHDDVNSPSFVKHAGSVLQHANSSRQNKSYWMNEGAYYYSPAKDGMLYGTDSLYSTLPYPEVISGSPVMIMQGRQVGDSTQTAWNESPLPREVKLGAHMRARHPRTAIASDARYIYLITADGRNANAAGMSIKELTNFIAGSIKPAYALNIDGGGSTTMWIKGMAPAYKGVVNHPSDNKKWDGFGQRKDRSFIIITPRK